MSKTLALSCSATPRYVTTWLPQTCATRCRPSPATRPNRPGMDSEDVQTLSSPGVEPERRRRLPVGPPPQEQAWRHFISPLLGQVWAAAAEARRPLS